MDSPDPMASRLRIVETPEIPVAVLCHRGPADTLPASIEKFVQWRRRAGLPPDRSRTFNILYPPSEAEPAQFRIDLCAGLPSEDLPDGMTGMGISLRVLPQGRVAQLPLSGPDSGIAPAARWLIGDWLPASGEIRRADPLVYLERIRFGPGVDQPESLLCLPLR